VHPAPYDTIIPNRFDEWLARRDGRHQSVKQALNTWLGNNQRVENVSVMTGFAGLNPTMAVEIS
jgi:hypothetical protein